MPHQAGKEMLLLRYPMCIHVYSTWHVASDGCNLVTTFEMTHKSIIFEHEFTHVLHRMTCING